MDDDDKREPYLVSKEADFADRWKRGSKPRPKRNRKRPRSDKRPNDDESKIQAQVVPLTLNGNEIKGGPAFLRLIVPYHYNFTSHAKARWVGRTVLDVYTSEFGGYPTSYYGMAITQGRILVNDTIVDTSYIIKATDVLVHCVHRHEPAVGVSLKEPPHVKIAGESEDILAIDKPGTLPVHPCGGYHQNSLMKVLEKEERFGKLYTIHRLDRLTSGLVVLAKKSAVAQAWGKAIQKREHCEKLYLARVKGRFPINCPTNIPCLALSAQKPLYGQWQSQSEASDDESPVAQARRKNALGYWMEDSRDNQLEDQSLQTISKTSYNIEACLLDLKTKDPSSLNIFSWLRFACPVRVAEHKNGVCVSHVELSWTSGNQTPNSQKICPAGERYF